MRRRTRIRVRPGSEEGRPETDMSIEKLALDLALILPDAPDERDGCVGRMCELLQGEGFRHIPAHEHLSPETARKLVHWLFEGGK